MFLQHFTSPDAVAGLARLVAHDASIARRGKPVSNSESKRENFSFFNLSKYASRIFFEKGTSFLLGIIFLIFLWHPRVKGCLEPLGFEYRILRPPAWCHDHLATATLGKKIMNPYQTEIRVEAFLDVLPIKFYSSCSDPQKDHSGQKLLCERPAQTCN